MTTFKWCDCMGCGVEGMHPDDEEPNKIGHFIIDKKGIDGVSCETCGSTDVVVDEMDESER